MTRELQTPVNLAGVGFRMDRQPAAAQIAEAVAVMYSRHQPHWMRQEFLLMFATGESTKVEWVADVRNTTIQIIEIYKTRIVGFHAFRLSDPTNLDHDWFMY